jgi:hypothetical protein
MFYGVLDPKNGELFTSDSNPNADRYTKDGVKKWTTTGLPSFIRTIAVTDDYVYVSRSDGSALTGIAKLNRYTKYELL